MATLPAEVRSVLRSPLEHGYTLRNSTKGRGVTVQLVNPTGKVVLHVPQTAHSPDRIRSFKSKVAKLPLDPAYVMPDRDVDAMLGEDRLRYPCPAEVCGEPAFSTAADRDRHAYDAHHIGPRPEPAQGPTGSPLAAPGGMSGADLPPVDRSQVDVVVETPWVADYLGFATGTISAMAKAGKLHPIEPPRRGTQTKFWRSDIEAYARAHASDSRDPTRDPDRMGPPPAPRPDRSGPVRVRHVEPETEMGRFRYASANILKALTSFTGIADELNALVKEHEEVIAERDALKQRLARVNKRVEALIEDL